ncbi:hypothetical protein DFS33DRAFT_1383642 [Desarmillaria ectypa]|nr:hypothetical protein DFS33DRAFT_1383642 [Desarmillaria ectypa]
MSTFVFTKRMDNARLRVSKTQTSCHDHDYETDAMETVITLFIDAWLYWELIVMFYRLRQNLKLLLMLLLYGFIAYFEVWPQTLASIESTFSGHVLVPIDTMALQLDAVVKDFALLPSFTRASIPTTLDMKNKLSGLQADGGKLKM